MKKIALLLVMIMLCLMISPVAAANTYQGDEFLNILTKDTFE